MKLIEFINGTNNKVYINPEKVTHIMEYRPGLTMVFFDNASEDKQSRVVVKGEIEEVASKLV